VSPAVAGATPMLGVVYYEIIKSVLKPIIPKVPKSWKSG
jgi:hypothetical protein